jgi:hypothetical protein
MSIFLFSMSAQAFELAAGPPEGGKVKWQRVSSSGIEYDEALAQAKQTKKPILIFFTCGCDDCKAFWAKQLSDDNVARFSEGYLRLLVRGNPALARKYQVEDCPELQICNSDGKARTVLRKERLIPMSGAKLAKGLRASAR